MDKPGTALLKTIFLLTSQNVRAFDNDTFYLVGAYQHAIFEDYHDGVIYSKDGGVSLQYSDCLSGTWARYGAFPSLNTWYISAGSWPGEESKRVHSSESRFGYSKNFDIIDNKLVWNTKPKVNKGDYTLAIAKTTDGGASWSNVLENFTADYYPNGIDCVSDSECWFVSEGDELCQIFHTGDGGRTWELQYEEVGSLMGVDMIDSNEGWAVGAIIGRQTFSTLFLHTLDGGRTWTVGDSIEGAYANSVKFYDAGHGYSAAFLLNGLSSILRYRQ